MVINGTAHAECNDFGKNPSPPAPIISPGVEDLPFGKFIWGTEAYPDNRGIWWVRDYVRNADDGPPLSVSWIKAGIDRSLLNPLQKREPICKSHFVGSTIKQPVPDPDAPIVYHLDRHTDAVVYSKDISQSGAPRADTPGKSDAAPASTSGQSSTPPANTSGTTGTQIETTITNQKGEAQPISFELAMQRYGDNYIRLSFKSSGHFQLGLPGFSTILGPSNAEQVHNILEEKFGIKSDRAPLEKFATSEGLKALFWNHDAPAGIEKLDTLFIYDATKTWEASIELRIEQNSNIQTKSGLALVFDGQNIPVLSTTIEYSVPVPK
jgi:hypothetical protein